MPGGVQLPNKGGNSVLGSTPLPTTSGCQPTGTSGIHHKPAVMPNGGQTMEGRGNRQHTLNARSWKSAGGESTNFGRISGFSTIRTGGQIEKVHREAKEARKRCPTTLKRRCGLRCYQQRIALQDITPGKSNRGSGR